MPRARLALAVTGATLALWAVPSVTAANFVYWSNSGGTTIGRAKLNGTGVNNSFITGLNDPHGVAVDSKYIYWSQGDAATGSIGRANLDGTGVDQSFVPHSAAINKPFGVTVTPTAVFWAAVNRYIGRADLDGSSPQPQFVDLTSSHNACGLAADGQFLYFTDTAITGAVGRVSQSGGTPDLSFVPGGTAGANCGAAVDGSFVYWSGVGKVGRATTAGASPNSSFIPAAGGPVVCGVAVNPQYLFWVNPTSPTYIGRSNLDGGAPNSTFIVGPSSPCLLAAAPSNKLTVTGTNHNKKKGTVKISGKVPGPGQVSLTPSAPATSAASHFKPQGLTLAAAGKFTLAIKAKGKTAKTLKKKGKVKVTYFLTYTPSGTAGVANSGKHTTTLRKKAKKK